MSRAIFLTVIVIALASSAGAAVGPAPKAAAKTTPWRPDPRLQPRLDALQAQTRALVQAAPAMAQAVAAPLVWKVGGIAPFKDCRDCPQMVVVPAGEFTMGSPVNERYRGAEAPHRVRIGYALAVSRYEITFAQWDACVAARGCGGRRLGDEHWGRGRRPAINATWGDAQAYAAWLTRKTGHAYRLLSESEWEYAARGGASGAYATGAAISARQANFDDSQGADHPARSVFRRRTTPVGAFKPNGFGLYDMHGNAWEWVEDCYNDAYTDQSPTDGSAWTAGDCSGRMLKGGSWEDYAGDLRAAARVSSGKDEGSASDGIRIARVLTAADR